MSKKRCRDPIPVRLGDDVLAVGTCLKVWTSNSAILSHSHSPCVPFLFHTGSDLRTTTQHTFIFSWFWKAEVQNGSSWVRIKLCAGLCSILEAPGDELFFQLLEAALFFAWGLLPPAFQAEVDPYVLILSHLPHSSFTLALRQG